MLLVKCMRERKRLDMRKKDRDGKMREEFEDRELEKL